MRRSTAGRLGMVLFSMILVLLLSSCGKKAAPEEEAITVSVSLGNGKAYFESLRELIREDLGIEIRFVYQSAFDTTNAVTEALRNRDFPADIIVTGSAFPEDALQGSCVDLMQSSVLMQSFAYGTLSEYTASDGSIYQLPFSSKLIGITYNETLLQEMGLSVPEDFQDLLDLKAACDEAGVVFSVSSGAAAGHGFNWLFHLMGAEWLSSPDGTQWFRSYLKGETDIGPFLERADYFRRFTEAGLFGSIHSEDWNASLEYREKRALFFFDLTNSLYRAYRLNGDGTIYGASYDASGRVVAVEDPEGEFVEKNGSWVLFDENDRSHRDCTRYRIPGSSIDTFRSIPWISEDGSTNTYTAYDNQFLMINKALEEKGQEERLAKAFRILEYMTTDPVRDLSTRSALDGYIAVKDFEITEDRTYAESGEKVKKGYTQPWYYLWVDTNTLMNTGNRVNEYLQGKADFEDVMDALDRGVQDNLQGVRHVVTDALETFGYDDMAKLLGTAGGQELEERLQETDPDMQVDAALMPYTEEFGDMVPWSVSRTGVVSTKLYEGPLAESLVNTLIPGGAQSLCGICLTGEELLTLREEGLPRPVSGDIGEPGVYPYVLLTKDGKEPEKDRMYLTAVAPLSLPAELYDRVVEEGRIRMDPADPGKPLTVSLRTALLHYFQDHGFISPGSILFGDTAP